MAKQTILAKVRARVATAATESPIAKKKYLTTDDTQTPEWNLVVDVSGGLLPVANPRTYTASTLIDAINAISTNLTKETQIDIVVDYGPPPDPGQSNWGYGGNFSINIDWEKGLLIWNGRQGADQGVYHGSAQLPGFQLIERLSSTNTTIRCSKGLHCTYTTYGDIVAPISLGLGTTNERTISRLPMPGAGRPWPLGIVDIIFGAWDGFVNVDYIITTDTGITVAPQCPQCEECPPEVVCAPATDCPPLIVCEPCAPCDPAAPCPPAEPCPPCPDPVAVVGVKISKLPTALSLQDDDLFVLSQDNPSDGDYDTSYRVTLAKLKAAVGASFQSGRWVAGDTLSISTTSVTSCAISIATGLTDSTDTGSIMGQFNVSSKSLSLAQVYNGGAGSAPATPEGKTKTLTDLLQDMDIQPGAYGVIVKARFDADTLSIELTGANMRGTYQITLS